MSDDKVRFVDFGGSRPPAGYVESATAQAKGGGGGGGMDAWQQSVEKRLDSLDRRMGTIGDDLGAVKVDLATVKTDVSHLPGKGFIVTAVIIALTAVSLVTGALVNLSKLVG